MFNKIHLSVTVALLLMGCKNIGDNYSALDDGGDRPSGSWAMVDLYLHEADDPEDEGEVNLPLSPHLTQDTRVNGVHLSFGARGSLNFSAPDANNIATLAEEDLLISRVEINFVNNVNALVCPDNPIVAELDRKDEEDQIEIGGGVIFSAMDLACSGNKLVEMNAIALSIVSHTWNEDHEAVLKEVEGFYEKEKKKGEGGALHKGEDQDINDHIDNFLIRRKMLKGYAAMHSELEKHQNLAEIKKQAKGDSAKHIVIPATMKSFLDARVNNRVTPDDSMSVDESTDFLLLKEAIGNAAVKFLQYDHLFQSDTDFASAKTRAKFAELKGRLTPEVRAHVDALETQFNKLKTDEGTYSTTNALYDLLYTRLTCMKTFLTNHQDEGEVCEDILGDVSAPLKNGQSS